MCIQFYLFHSLELNLKHFCEDYSPKTLQRFSSFIFVFGGEINWEYIHIQSQLDISNIFIFNIRCTPSDFCSQNVHYRTELCETYVQIPEVQKGALGPERI